MIDEDRCAVCDDPRSTERDQILYCDGPECNMPVHQYCYGVRVIPEGDWFCQRCHNKKFYRKVNIICCTTQAGAIKRTTESTEFMHVQCAIYNKEIDHTKEPYLIDKSKLGQFKCSLCLQEQGFCVRCEEPGCSKSFHVTCGINAGLVHLSRIPPQNPTYRCGAHMNNAIPSSTNSRKPGKPVFSPQPTSKVSNNHENTKPDAFPSSAASPTPSSGLVPSKRPRQDPPTTSSPKMRPLAPPKIENRSSSSEDASSSPDYAKTLMLESEVAYLKQKLAASQEEVRKLRNVERQAQDAQEHLEQANQQIERLRRELYLQSEFKRITTEIFTTLNIQTAHVSPAASRMDEYVTALRDTLDRTGPPRPDEWRHIINFSQKLLDKRPN